MAEHALGVGPVERETGEELGRHAPAPAGVVVPARPAGARALRPAQLGEELRVAPHLGEPAGRAHVAGQELVVDGEGAGVDVADRVHQADHPARAAEVEAGQRLAVPGQVEERVAGQDVFAVGHQPVVEDPLLPGGGMELVPHVRAPARRPQAGEAELGPVPVGQRLEGVELGDVVAGDHHRELEAAKPAAASRSMAVTAVAYEPAPRTASLTSAVAPSREICTSM